MGPMSDETIRIWVRTYLEARNEVRGKTDESVTDTDVDEYCTLVRNMKVVRIILLSTRSTF